MANGGGIDSTAVSIFVVVLVELTNTVFVNSTNITTNFETAVLSTLAALRKVRGATSISDGIFSRDKCLKLVFISL